MKALFKKAAYALVALALLAVILGANITTAHALGTIRGQNDSGGAGQGGNTYWTDAGSAVVTTTVPWAGYWSGFAPTQKLTYHVRGIGCNQSITTGYQVQMHLQTDNNPGTQTVYYAMQLVPIQGTSVGTFTVTDGVNALSGTGTWTGSLTVGAWTPNVTWIRPAGCTVPIITEFMVYIWESTSPINLSAEAMNVTVELDNANIQFQSAYLSNLQAYLDESNLILARSGSWKHWVWNPQTVVEKDTPAVAFNFGTTCNYSGTPNNYLLWFYFDTGFGDPNHKIGSYTLGRDCQGYGAIAIATNPLNNTEYAPPAKSSIVESQTDTANGTTYWYFWYYVSAITHELVHTFGGYMNELYNNNLIQENTTWSPILDISVMNPFDAWWTGSSYFGGPYHHPDLRYDIGRGANWTQDNIGVYGIPAIIRPMWHFADVESNMVLTSFTVQFANTWAYTARLHTTSVSGGYGGSVVDDSIMTSSIHTITVTQTDENGVGKSGVLVDYWYLTDNDGAWTTTYGSEVATGAGGVVTVTARPGVHGDPSYGYVDSMVMLKSFTMVNNIKTPYGRPVVVDLYQLEQYVFSNGTGATTYPITMTHAATTHVVPKIGTVTEPAYDLASNSYVSPQYSGMQTGPVLVQGDPGAGLITSQRVIYNNNFSEVVGTSNSALTTHYWFPWYDDKDMITWVMVGNPSNSVSANVTIKVAGIVRGSYTVSPGQTITPTFSGVQSGPVEVTSNVNVFTSERTIFNYPANPSFNELMGYPDNQLTNHYWFTWYDNKDLMTWVLIANPSTTLTANVTIKIAGSTVGTYTLGPGAISTPTFGTLQNGPVEVTSDNNIITSERVLYNNTFHEVTGFPDNQAVATLWMPWYDNVNAYSWIMVGDPDLNKPSYIAVYVGGIYQNGYIISPGTVTAIRLTGVNGGPVKIITSQSEPQRIFASVRSLYNYPTRPSFNETLAIPDGSLSDAYWFPWYDDTSMATNLLMIRP